MTLLLAYLFLALGVSFLCSLLEAALLSIPPSYAESLAATGSATGRRMAHLKAHIDRPLAAILTLNTVAHTFGAAGVGAEAAVLFGHAWIGAVSVVVTILILLFSEIVPKTLGAVHAKRLAGFTALTCVWLIYATYPIVVVCRWLSKLVSRGRTDDAISRDEVIATVNLGGDAGALSADERQAIGNLLELQRVPIKDVMTPRPVVFSLPEDTTVARVIADHRPLRFARIPLHRGSVDQLTGLVHRFRIFEAYADGKTDATLRSLAAPIVAIPEVITVGQALPQFLENHAHLFQVVDEFGGTAGVVTLEDALETLLGREIVGETDPVVDMRRLARRLAERRWAAHEQRRSDGGPDAESGD